MKTNENIVPVNYMEEKRLENALNFGRNMRIMRKDLKLTAVSFAKFVGISPAHVALMEMGERVPSFHTLLRICEFFGKDPTYMITDHRAGTLSLTDSANRPKPSLETKHELAMSMIKSFEEKELNKILNDLKARKDAE